MRHPSARIVAAAVAATVAATLVGCSSGPRVVPITPSIGSHPYSFADSGAGTRTLSSVRAVGPFAYGASCVGSGSLTMSLPPTNLKIKVPCVSSNSNTVTAGSQTGVLDASTTIHPHVAAAAGSSWKVAFGYSTTPDASPTPPAALSAVEKPGDGAVVLKRLLSQTAGADFTVNHIAQPRVQFDNVCWGHGELQVTIAGVGSYNLRCSHGARATQIGEGYPVPDSKTLDIQTSVVGDILWSMTVIGATH